MVTTDVNDFGELSTKLHKLVIGLTFTSAFSAYIRIIPIKQKNEAALQFANYAHFIESSFDARIAMIRSDKAKELIKGDFKDFRDRAGIDIDFGYR